MIVWALLLVVFSCAIILKWNELRYGRKGAPPGWMGYPLFGETGQFLNQGPSFMQKQKDRHGNLFKTHILGSPTVICMDPDLNRYILLNEGKSFAASYPQSMYHILGKSNIGAVHGVVHKTMRGSFLSITTTASIRDSLHKIDQVTRSHVSDLNEKIIDIQDKTKEVVLDVALKLLGIEGGTEAASFKPEFYKLLFGAISLPIYLPGTRFQTGLNARKKILGMLRKIMENRSTSPGDQNSWIDSLLRSGESSKFNLSDEQIMDQVITLLHSAFETISPTAMMAVKYLYEHPKLLEELREENFKIRNGKAPNDPIDWNDYKSMQLTRYVIFETLRLASVTNGVMRKATKDIKMNGYIIPKGWKVYVYTREINYDPSMYPEPLKFNPWRWQDKSLESHPHFLAFGGGCRLCPGKELALVETCIFLHYFATKYRWELLAGDKLRKFPRVEAPNGLRIRVWNY